MSINKFQFNISRAKRVFFHKFLRISIVFLIIFAWIFSGWPQLGNFPPKVEKVEAGSQVYSSGSGNWVSPTTGTVIVECWGGGGAGGGFITNKVIGRGGGGAGGQYAIKSVSVTQDTSYAYVVGTGGTGGEGDGPTGNDTTFGGGTVVAKGGAGGQSYESGGTAGQGSTTSGVGDTVYAGGNGSAGGSVTTGGAGGGGAGSTGAGGNASGNTAGTGTSELGGDGGAGIVGQANGNPGNNYGGAGSGGSNNPASNTNRSGGSGAGGYIRITWTDAPVYSVTLDRENFSYGTMNDNTASSTLTLWSEAGIIATNGDAIADFYIYGANTTNWTLDTATSTTDHYVHKFCNETDNNCAASGPYGASFIALTTSPGTLLKGSVAPSGQVAFQLSMHTPNPSTVYTTQNAVVTVQASAP